MGGFMSTAAGGREFHYFFLLPPELRDEILSYLVVTEKTVTFGSRERGRPSATPLDDQLTAWAAASGAWGVAAPRGRDHGAHCCRAAADDAAAAASSSWPLNYFLVSRAFHREASDLFFRKNRFLLDCRAFAPHECLSGGVGAGAGGSPVVPALPRWYLRKQMCRVVLDVDPDDDGGHHLLPHHPHHRRHPRRPPADHLRRAARELADMVAHGRLARLEVRVAGSRAPVRRVPRGAAPPAVAALALRQHRRALVLPPGPAAAAAVPASPRTFWHECPPLLGRLLAHPGLRDARLRVAASHHPRAWCSRHAAVRRTQTSPLSTSRVPMCVCEPLWGNAEEFLDVDFGGLALDAAQARALDQVGRLEPRQLTMGL